MHPFNLSSNFLLSLLTLTKLFISCTSSACFFIKDCFFWAKFTYVFRSASIILKSKKNWKFYIVWVNPQPIKLSNEKVHGNYQQTLASKNFFWAVNIVQYSSWCIHLLLVTFCVCFCSFSGSVSLSLWVIMHDTWIQKFFMPG